MHHNVDLTGQLYKSYNLPIRSSNVSASLVFKILIFFFFFKEGSTTSPPKASRTHHSYRNAFPSVLCRKIYGHMIQASFLCIGHDHFQEKKSEYLKTAGNEGRG